MLLSINLLLLIFDLNYILYFFIPEDSHYYVMVGLIAIVVNLHIEMVDSKQLVAIYLQVKLKSNLISCLN